MASEDGSLGKKLLSLMGMKEAPEQAPSKLEPIQTKVPGTDPIELVAYYKEFVWYYPECELNSKAWFVQNAKPDWVILDCGANVGYYSVLFSRLVPSGKVYAFEPTSTMDFMLANLEHNKAKHNVECFRVALGEKKGLSRDPIYRIWGQTPEKNEVQFTTIDEFVAEHKLPRVDCIKIDVDSYDFEVLKGAKETLLAMDPYVVVELNHALNLRGKSNTEALSWMAQLGYRNTLTIDYENFVFKRGTSPCVNAFEYSMNVFFSKPV